MQNASFIFVATATTKHFNKGGAESSVDKNGNYPIQLTVSAGKAPARSLVISGSVAMSQGIEAGKTYVVQATLRDINDYGDNWNHLVLGTLTTLDLIKLNDFKAAYGQPKVINYADSEVEVSATNGESEE